MTKQVVNIGTQPNDRTGDTLRNAYDKLNQNSTELYNRVANSENTIVDIQSDVSTLFVDTDGISMNVANVAATVNAFNAIDAATFANLSSKLNVAFTTGNSAYTLANTSLQTTSYYSVGSNSRTISFNTTGGLYPPDVTSRIGERVVLWDQSPSSFSYSMGVETDSMWFGVDTGAPQFGFHWYSGNTYMMRLDRTANLRSEEHTSELQSH